MTTNELLTADEREVIRLLGEAASIGFRVIDHGQARGQDSIEWATRIHAAQHMIMAQAAARAYPEQYRLLGQAHG